MKLSGPVEIIKQSISLFFKRENFLYFIKIYTILVPFTVFSFFQGIFFNSASNSLTATDIGQILSRYGWFLWVSIPVGLLYVIISFWVSVSGIKAVANVTGNLNRDIKSTLQFSWKILWRFSLLAILFLLIEIGGLILLIIPAIIFGVWYGFAQYIFVNEEKGVRESLGVSKNLVTGRFWKVFGRLFVFGLFGILVQIIFSLIPFGLGSVISPFFGALLILPNFLLYKELSAQKLTSG